MRKSRWSKLSAVVASSVLALGLLAGCGGGSESSSSSDDGGGDSGSSEASGGEVVIGGIFDETGATGDVGAPYADGARAYFDYINSKGGIDGVKVNLVNEDYAYDISRAQQIYQSLRDRHKAVGIIGWGTGDTEALRAQIIADEIPFISGSLSENLKDTGSESGYNYLIAATYSDQGRAILEWIAANHEGSKPATVALVYDESNPFSSSPMDDIKAYAAENLADDIKIVNDILIGLSDQDPQTTLQAYQNSNDVPDYAIIQYTWNQTRNVIRDAYNLGWDTQFVSTNWGAGEGLIPSGSDNQQWVEALDGTIATILHAFPFEDEPGMAEIKEYLEANGKSLEDINQKFVQGWASAMIYAEAIRVAIEQNGGTDFSGADFKKAIESLDNVDLKGLAANVSFSPDKHWGTKDIRLGQLKDGKWEIIEDYFSYEDLAK